VSSKREIPLRSRNILRYAAGSAPRDEQDQLAVEEPLEIRVDTRPVSVTMRTPGHDEELAVGFLLSEGLIRSASDVLKTVVRGKDQGNVVDVFLAPGIAIDFARLTRHVFASSSCGLCGKATIDAVHLQFPPVTSAIRVSAKTLLSLSAQLQQSQETFNRTGGLHAAALFDEAGKLLVLREDVGRHNAVDKVLGYGLLANTMPMEHYILLVSGRASFEIVQKALAARIPIIAAVSAPSSLAVEFAEQSGQTLVGFLRGERMNVYSRPERIQFDSQCPEDHI
jgi:FdhD protein